MINRLDFGTSDLAMLLILPPYQEVKLKIRKAKVKNSMKTRARHPLDLRKIKSKFQKRNLKMMTSLRSHLKCYVVILKQSEKLPIARGIRF